MLRLALPRTPLALSLERIVVELLRLLCDGGLRVLLAHVLRSNGSIEARPSIRQPHRLHATLALTVEIVLQSELALAAAATIAHVQVGD